MIFIKIMLDRRSLHNRCLDEQTFNKDNHKYYKNFAGIVYAVYFGFSLNYDPGSEFVWLRNTHIFVIVASLLVLLVSYFAWPVSWTRRKYLDMFGLAVFATLIVIIMFIVMMLTDCGIDRRMQEAVGMIVFVLGVSAANYIYRDGMDILNESCNKSYIRLTRALLLIVYITYFGFLSVNCIAGANAIWERNIHLFGVVASLLVIISAYFAWPVSWTADKFAKVFRWVICITVAMIIVFAVLLVTDYGIDPIILGFIAFAVAVGGLQADENLGKTAFDIVSECK